MIRVIHACHDNHVEPRSRAPSKPPKVRHMHITWGAETTALHPLLLLGFAHKDCLSEILRKDPHEFWYEESEEVLWLHCVRYTGPDWSYDCPYPDWAVEILGKRKM